MEFSAWAQPTLECGDLSPLFLPRLVAARRVVPSKAARARRTPRSLRDPEKEDPGPCRPVGSRLRGRSPLWSAATCRRFFPPRLVAARRVVPSKAARTRRTPRSLCDPEKEDPGLCRPVGSRLHDFLIRFGGRVRRYVRGGWLWSAGHATAFSGGTCPAVKAAPWRRTPKSAAPTWGGAVKPLLRIGSATFPAAAKVLVAFTSADRIT